MTDQLLGELRIMAFGVVPRGWAACNGQLLQIAPNQALFSLLGTFYGGDGVTTFGLPNLQGRTPVGPNNPVQPGQTGGAETVSLTSQQNPTHNHLLRSDSGTPADANSNLPTNHALGATQGLANPGGPFNLQLYGTTAPSAPLNGAAVANAGGSAPHENRQPYLSLNICIATQGLYPSRP